VFYNHPRVKPDLIDQRDYQTSIAKVCANRSTLVVVPTGLGKTVIALMVLADRMDTGKILFLAPTRPLVEQHARFLQKALVGAVSDGAGKDAEVELKAGVDPTTISVFTGTVPPAKRTERFRNSDIIVSTPQVIENDLISGRIDLSEVSLVIFDEAHRGVGNYAYVFIAERYRQDRPMMVAGEGGREQGPDGERGRRRGPGSAGPSDRNESDRRMALGITASPGSSAEKILEVCENLELYGVEIRSEYDADVYPYVQKVKITWTEVELPKQVKRIRDLMNELYVEYLKKLQLWGLLNQTTMVSKKMLLDTQRRIQARIHTERDPPKNLFQAAALQSGCMKLNHGMELAETQGIHALREYFDRMDSEAHSRSGGKAAKLILADERIRMAIRLTRKEEGEHPKLQKVLEVVNGELRRNSDSRIIVFTHFRDTAEMVTRELARFEKIRPVRFVGQASRGADKGMSQKEQVGTIKQFEEGEYNVLVATSVAEEGLDIPSTDLVVFYEPVPSEIRTIQRRGRTGRKQAGKVIILITKGTRDNAYYWASKNKEKNMQMELRGLRKALKDKIQLDQSIEERNENRNMNRNGERKSIREQLHGPEPTSLPTPPPVSGEPSPQPRSASDPEPIHETPPASSYQAPPHTPHTHQTHHLHHPTHREESAGEDPIPSIKKGQTHIFDYREQQMKKLKESEESNADGPDRDREHALMAQNWNVGEGMILVDTREFNSAVVKELSRMGYKINSEQIDVGDYVLSDRLAIERKAVDDFISSLKDGRLFHQLGHLRRSFTRPIVIIEGEGLLDAGGMNPASIYGALASIVTDYGIPVIQTRDDRETATMISAISKREYAESRPTATRVDLGAGLVQDRQHFIIEGLPGVSAVLARRLLDHFGSVRAVLLAPEEELMEVKGVGKKIATEIAKVIDEGYLRKKIATEIE
jgi:ERCC4-related helicase/ERCC4-type nuclease